MVWLWPTVRPPSSPDVVHTEPIPTGQGQCATMVNYVPMCTTIDDEHHCAVVSIHQTCSVSVNTATALRAPTLMMYLLTEMINVKYTCAHRSPSPSIASYASAPRSSRTVPGTNRLPELSVKPFSRPDPTRPISQVTKPDPTYRRLKNLDPTQLNPTHCNELLSLCCKMKSVNTKTIRSSAADEIECELV